VQVKYKATDQGTYLNTDGSRGWGTSPTKEPAESPSYIDIANSYPASFGSPGGAGSHFYPGIGGGGGSIGQVFNSGSNGPITAEYVGAQTRAGAANPQYGESQDQWTITNTKPPHDVDPMRQGKYQTPVSEQKQNEFDMTAAFETSNQRSPPGGDLPEDVIDELTSIFLKADTGNGDHMGVLSKTEIKFRLDVKQIRNLLVKLNLLHYFDEDGDGELTATEIINSMDNNGDGVISLGEFIGAVRKSMADARMRQTAALTPPVNDEFVAATGALLNSSGNSNPSQHPNTSPSWPVEEADDEFEAVLGGLNPLPSTKTWSSQGSADAEGMGLQPAFFEEGNSNLQSGYAVPEDPGYLEPALQQSGEIQWATRASSDLATTPPSKSRPALDTEADDEFGFAESTLISQADLSGGEFGTPLSTITEVPGNDF
jgi:hypothetical protein